MAVHSPGDAGLAGWGTGVDTRLDGLDAALDAIGSLPTKTFIGTTGDRTSALQAFLDGLVPGDLAIVRGAFSFTTVTCATSGVHILLALAGSMTKTTAFTDGIVLTGDDVILTGGTIVSPASWDGTNVAPTYAVVRATGARHKIRGVTLDGVPKVGIASHDADGTSTISDNRVTGNYPAGSWTGVETVHYGVLFDPGLTASRVRVTNNTIDSCVQGIFLGNYGTGSSVGSLVADNDITGCHNHALYGSASVTSCIVTGNTIVDCASPIALTGANHDVSHNRLAATGTGGNLHTTCSINMRDAVGCTVSHNNLTGDLSADGAPAIDVSTLSGLTVRSNRVFGNRVLVTGTNPGIGIRIGAATATDVTDNIVSGNVVSAPGVTNLGVVALFASGSVGQGNKVTDNDITITGPSHGVYVGGHTGADVHGNHIRLEYNAASAQTLAAIYLSSVSAGTRFSGNDVTVTSSYGTNVAFRGVWEASGTLANRIGPNRYSLNPTLLTSATIHVISTTSATILDETLPGAPAVVCGPGSVWHRTDGGVGTSLYVKETAASSATWARVNTTTP